MKARKLLIRLAALLVCVALGAIMMVIGRGHTVYLDNKTLEYNGQTYKAFYKVEITVKGEQVGKLYARERASTPCIGQRFHMDLAITDEQGGEERLESLDVELPYSLDGPILNLPALLNGLPQEAWLDEFIPTPSSVEEPVEDPAVGDDMGLDIEGLDG